MKKRILSLLLALFLAAGLLPHATAAELASGSFDDNLTWVLTDDGTLTISGEGPMYGFGSNGSDRPWHAYTASIQKVIINDGVSSIASWAFLDCSNLADVSIAASVSSIDYGAFENCVKLSEVQLPEGLTHLCINAFANCDSLEEITLHAQTEICKSPFYDCDSLKAIYVSEENPLLCSEQGVLFDKDKTLLIQCPGGYEGHYVIPDSVSEVWIDAFSRCRLLTGITIPASLSTNAPLLSGCDSLTDLAFAHGTTTIGVLNWDYFDVQRIEIPNTVTTIEPDALAFTSITSLTIPASVTRIGEGAFDAINLEEIHFLGDAPAVYAAESGAEAEEVIPFGYFVTAYYPAGNATWTQAARDAISSTATWVAWDPNNPFTDVSADSFYYDPVLWAVENNITSGASDTTFNPNGQCLRAQVVTFLWRAEGCPEPTSTVNPFTDVSESDWYYKAVLWAVEKGITTGTSETTFGPMGVCNRAQVVTFLHRAFGSPAVESTSNPFTDVPGSAWYAAPVLWAVENEITNGLSATEFGPDAACNRAQVVTFLYRAYN